MKSPIAAALLIAAAALPALAHEAAASSTTTNDEVIFTTQVAATQNCSPADSVLCPVCDRNNIVDAAGHEYTITCDYEVQGNSEDDVDGWTSTAICMEACDENEGCFAINFAPSGSCSIVKGALTGMTRRTGHSNMLRIVPNSTTTVTSTSERTSYVDITSTVYGSGEISTSAKITSTATATATASSSSSSSDFVPAPTDECNLELENLCPRCNDREVTGKGNKEYRILCDSTFVAASSNATYSVQEFSSPESCLADCADFPLCQGAIFSDGQDCELAKASDALPASREGYTAFMPLSPATPAPTVRTPQTATVPTKTSPPAGTATILPVDSGCNLTSLSCPACDGLPYVDRLNGSYTVVCDFEPICDSVAMTRDGGLSQEACMEGCDQDVACLAALFYPDNGSCHLCQQGMDEGVGTNLPYIVLVADIDGDNNITSSSSPASSHSIGYSEQTATYTTSQSITDFPAPYSTTAYSATVQTNPVGPIGPVVWTNFASNSRPTSSGPAITLASTITASSAIHLTAPTTPAEVTNIAAVVCPSFDGDVYVELESRNYFAVACDSQFAAAHSRYISASDFAACAASCDGQCDGIQFGYTTRCGLYTDISIVGPAAGWTVAASITFPTPLSTTNMARTTSGGPAGYTIAVPLSQTSATPYNGTRKML